MRIDIIYFLIVLIMQVIIFLNIKKINQKSVYIVLISIGITISSVLFFWNNAILIDELGINGNIFSFSFLGVSLLLCLINIYFFFTK